MDIIQLDSGKVFDLYALLINDKCQVKEYISNLDEINQKQIFALFTHILEKGPPSNIQKFNYIGDGIYELKTWRGVRILSFYGDLNLPRSLILTHGFPKPKKKKLLNEKVKAVKWHKEYLGISDIKKIIIMEGKS